ncbi:MAG: polyphosphate:AMP phosphotransferase [Mailhella sp.]
MFENIVLGRHFGDDEYKEQSSELRMKLFGAQRKCIDRHIPLLIIVNGVEGAGRGAVINLLSEWMDGKYVHNHAFWMETDEERERPFDWRYWRILPSAGTTGVFFGGWYGHAIRSLCTGDMDKMAFSASMHHYRGLEESLAASGMAIVKIWLHLDKKEHDKRIQKRLSHKKVLHFTPYDKKLSENYDGVISAAAQAITLTDRSFAPWTIVDAADANYRNIAVVKAIIASVERTVAEQDAKKARSEKKTSAEQEDVISTLDAIDLGVKADYDAYKKDISRLQSELHELTYRAYRKGISSTLIFEGWDAAGKGGSIRRLMAGIDARICRAIPIAAPSDEELAHHYLWRFWRHVPRAGFITVYDRSWYGRVLVERVEGLTPREDWSRAYSEINLFESQLTRQGNVLVKFWLHISPDEQLRRFKEREETPWKQYKITAEDWRNREKWQAYRRAADEMFLRTSTECAPWHIIPAEDKKYARIAVLKAYRDALKKALKDAEGKKVHRKKQS